MILAQTYVDIGNNLTSVTGITTITFALVEALKSAITDKTKWYGRIPTWIYSVVIAMGLAFAANKVFKVNGHPLLAGDVFEVIWQAAVAAASASGIFSWMNRGSKKMAESDSLLKKNEEPNESKNRDPDAGDA